MIEIKGDLFTIANDGKGPQNRPADAVVCTINTTLRANGCLVMGAGIAKGFRDTFSGIDQIWGDRTKEMGPQPEKTYPFVDNAEHLWKPNQWPGIDRYVVGIHTKFDWRQDSPLYLIDRSIKQLYIIANALRWKRIVMTRPGCGHGGRSWDREVRPVLAPILDDRFEVVTL